MAAEESTKRIWKENTTKLLISVFKDYYELWKNGTIGKKNQMWQQIAETLNKQGLECTASQAENRFKTLQRSYRKTCGISSKNERRCHHPFAEELSNVFNSLQDDETIIIDANQDEQFLDESTGSIYTIQPQVKLLRKRKNDESSEDSNTSEEKTPNVEKIFNKHKTRRKFRSKSNVDVLLEIKELLKKVEIRRQARHEQNLKIARERNAILKRKNEILENLLLQQE